MLAASHLRQRARKVVAVVPGFAACAALAWMAEYLADLVGVRLLGFAKTPLSPVLVAIVLGLTVRAVIPSFVRLQPGVDFSVKRVLRAGIILLGIRLSVGDVFRLGAYGIPIVLTCVAAALFITLRANRWLGLPPRLGALIAIGTSICGVTAIVASAPALEADEDEMTYAVAVITVFGLVATLAYPYLAHAFFAGQPVEAGLFLGTSIHETSQVVGAASVYAGLFDAPRALDVATVTKLVRNVFMVVIVPTMALLHARETSRVPVRRTSVVRLFPVFILGFLLLAVVRSVGDSTLDVGGQAFGVWDPAEWSRVHGAMESWAAQLLVVALAGVGLSTDFRKLRRLGLRPFLVGLSAALSVGIVSCAAIVFLGSLVAL